MARSSRRIFRGSPYADRISQEIIGNGVSRRVFALGGDDDISIDNNANLGLSLYGGSGSDLIASVASASVFSRNGRSESQLAPRLYGQSGDDVIRDLLGSSTIASGGAGNDKILYNYNRGGRSFDRGRSLVSGGAGNDIISYWTPANANVVVRGGAGDDLIGVETNVYGNSSIQQAFYGDTGDDTFYVAKPPIDRSTTFVGGEGFDTLYIETKYNYTLVRTSEAKGKRMLTFAYWQRNGVTRETSVVAKSVEKIEFGGPVIPYKYGNDQGYGDIFSGSRYEAWNENLGFGY